MKTTIRTFSHAHALRVIGQNLHDLAIDRFELDKAGPAFIVWISADGAHAEQTSPSPHVAICFNQSQLLQLEGAGQSRRGESSDGHDLASKMRVLGHYLDRKRADDFSLRWERDLVRVEIGGERQTFSVHQNLYDLAVCMSLQRSGRTVRPTLAPKRQENGRPEIPLDAPDAQR